MGQNYFLSPPTFNLLRYKNEKNIIIMKLLDDNIGYKEEDFVGSKRPRNKARLHNPFWVQISSYQQLIIWLPGNSLFWTLG